MNSFLQQTAQSIISTIDWQQLNRTTLVLPSHRAGLVLKNELLRLQQESGAPVTWAPQVQTLTQLQDSLSPLYAEDELFTIVRLFRIYRELNAGEDDLMPLDMFYGWGRQMLADFTNIDASMPAEKVANFFENTVAAHELGELQLDEETKERLEALMADRKVGSIQKQYERLWRQLFDLYTGLQAEMEAEKKGYAGMRQRAVIAHWEDDYMQSKIAGRTYIFVGFNYLLPVELDLMKLLRNNGQAMFYWDYVRDFHTNTKAFSFAERNSEILGNANPDANANAKANADVTVISCVSREAQAQYVHRWLQDNYTEKGQKVGIVICDETMLEPVIYTLPEITPKGSDEPMKVNITKGFPLRNTAVYARTLRWLNDPMRGKAEDIVSPEFIGQMEKEVLTPDAQLPSSAQYWQELLILESEYQVRKIANQMRSLITDGLGDVPFTLKLLRLLMRRTMESVTMPFHGEPVTDVQVMGVLETRLLDFDKLLLLNVEEGVLPQKQTDLSFIPFYLRKAYHMQTSDERATVYAYNFFRLLSRAGHATMMYASADTSDGGKGMSRFVMQIRYSPEFNVVEQRLEEPNRLQEPCALHMTTTERASFKRLSPSALNTYVSCPRSFYLQYVLGLHPKEDETVLFKPNTLGSFVHHAMEFLYGRFLEDATEPVSVSSDDIEAIRNNEPLLQQALDAAYVKMNERWQKDYPNEPNHYVQEHHRGENVIIKGYVKNILERDREDAKVGLQLCRLEQKCYFPVEIDGVGTIDVGGAVDRVDIYGPEGNKCLRVIDYKSGGYSSNTHEKKMSASWDDLMESEDKGYVRQTLIYSHAVMQQGTKGLRIEPHLFFCRRKLTEIVTTIDVADSTVHDYAAIQEPFKEALKNKIAEIFAATDFPQCDEDKCPTFCPFFTLCGRKSAQTY